MNSLVNSPDDISRRRLLQRTIALTAAAAFTAPTKAKAVHPKKLQLRVEGDVDLDWVLSLYVPPALAAGFPPGTAGRLRLQYPATSTAANRGYGDDVMDISSFLAPAGVPEGVPAPELATISALQVAVDEVMLDVATFGEESTRPRKNVAILGRIIANNPESPFGSLVGRVATTSFGFEWTAVGSDTATFKLVAVGAAGSHLTVLREGGGEIVLA